MDLCNVTASGRLTRDVEIKNLASGMEVAKFGIACNTSKEDASFFDCDVYGKQANTAQRFLRKGSRVMVTGKLSQQFWTGKDGGQKSKMCISVHQFAMMDSRPQQNADITGEHDATSPF